jgi:tryptophan synthase beta chain
VPQAFYNKEAGIAKLSTETGAGQWGSSLAFAGQLFGLDVRVFMVKVSFNQKPYRRALMETYGASCIASPSDQTNSGRAILAQDPESPGSLGIAISEAVEIAATSPDTNYALGSVLNHVLLHQSVTGIEAIEQMEMAGDWPDIVVGCTGGGSNFAGIAFPILGKRLREGKAVRIIAAEPAAPPPPPPPARRSPRGVYAYDFGDTGHLTPLVKMHTLGSTFIPPAFHAGGLRYHGMAPMVSHLKELGLIEARAVRQLQSFDAGVTFARAEGIVPAPEATHAIRAVFDEALRCKVEGKSETILFNLCGHGHFDMQAYTDYFAGKLEDRDYDEAALKAALDGLPPGRRVGQGRRAETAARLRSASPGGCRQPGNEAAHRGPVVGLDRTADGKRRAVEHRVEKVGDRLRRQGAERAGRDRRRHAFPERPAAVAAVDRRRLLRAQHRRCVDQQDPAPARVRHPVEEGVAAGGERVEWREAIVGRRRDLRRHPLRARARRPPGTGPPCPRSGGSARPASRLRTVTISGVPVAA